MLDLTHCGGVKAGNGVDPCPIKLCGIILPHKQTPDATGLPTDKPLLHPYGIRKAMLKTTQSLKPAEVKKRTRC